MLNPAYEDSEQEVRGVLRENGFSLLGNVLTTDARDALKRAADTLFFNEERVPDMHDYEQAAPSDELREAVEALAEYVKNVMDSSAQLETLRVRKYAAGSYTLQHDEQYPNGIHLTLFLTDHDWQRDYRGEHTFVPGDDDEPLIIPPEDNSLAVVEQTGEDRRFVKRVTYLAGPAEYVAVEAVLR